MWVVVQVDVENSVYTLLNAAGGTYADLAGGTNLLARYLSMLTTFDIYGR